MSSAPPMLYGTAYTLTVGSLALSYDDLRKWAYLYPTGLAITFAPTSSTTRQIMSGDTVQISADINVTNYLSLPATQTGYLRWSLVFSDNFLITSPAGADGPPPVNPVPISLGVPFSLACTDGRGGQVCLDSTGLYLVLGDPPPVAMVAALPT